MDHDIARLPDHDAVPVAGPGEPTGAHAAARSLLVGDDSPPTVRTTLARNAGVDPPGFEYGVPVILGDGGATPLGHVDSPPSVNGGPFERTVLSSGIRASRADGMEG